MSTSLIILYKYHYSTVILPLSNVIVPEFSVMVLEPAGVSIDTIKNISAKVNLKASPGGELRGCTSNSKLRPSMLVVVNAAPLESTVNSGSSTSSKTRLSTVIEIEL